MSYKLAKAALHLEGLPTTQKIVLIALADFANDETGECWPAQETIAGLCGMSRKTVNQSVKALTDKGLVMQIGWHGKTPNYRLNLLPTVTPVTESYTKAPVTESNTYLLPTVTPPVTQGYTKVLPTVTQTDNINREDNKESNKQASNSIQSNNIENPPKEKPQTETPKMTPQAPQAKPLPACPAAAANVAFTLKDIALSALAKLKAEGIAENEAKAKLNAVAEEFKAEAKTLRDGGYAGIANPRNYLIAKLVGMAKEGPKQQAEPQPHKATLTAEEALKAITEYYQTSDEYKAIAEHIPDILDSPWHKDQLAAEAKSNWGGKDPLDVAKRIYGKRVAEQAQSWLESARKQELEAIARKRRRQAEKQAVESIKQREAQGESMRQKVILAYLRKRVDLPLNLLEGLIAKASANHWEGMTEFRWADLFVAVWEAKKAKSA